MTTQRDNRATYRVISKHNYLVTLERLKNDYYGNPRFEATIINTDIDNEYYIGSFVYRFSGHHNSEYDEAKYIVNYHEEKDEYMRKQRG